MSDLEGFGGFKGWVGVHLLCRKCTSLVFFTKAMNGRTGEVLGKGAIDSAKIEIKPPEKNSLFQNFLISCQGVSKIETP